MFEKDGKHYATMTEPHTGKMIVIYDLMLLGGDEPPVAYVRQCDPDPVFFNKSLEGVVFLFSHFESIINEMVTGFVRVAKGSKLIPMEDINDGYSGIVLQVVDALTFIELKETVNVQVLTEASQTEQKQA